MGFTIEDMLILSKTRYKMEMIAGDNGWSNSISWVHLLEDTTIIQHFWGKELAVTTGLGFKTTGALKELLEDLIRHHAAGLIINVGKYIMEVPREIIEYCNTNDFPLMIVPWEIFLSDIIKDFSNGEMVESKTMGDWRVHNGVDFGGSAGNEVVAVAKGKITKVEDDIFWGTVVEIDHGNGMTVRYCGLKEGSCLPEGTEVEKYDKIGSLGHIPVEISDEDHLHLEVMIDGEYVDPLKALNKVGTGE